MTDAPPTNRSTIDLNADVGEGRGDDAALIPLVTSANIACGAHAGDDATMADAVRLAVRHGVAIGAHPGHDDRENFGRVERSLEPAEAVALVGRQLKRLSTIARRLGGTVRYVKPHGALYHQAAGDGALAAAIVEATRRADARLALVGPPGSALLGAASAAGLRGYAEGFADRAYREDGRLAPRSNPGAMINCESEAAAQALELAVRGRAPTLDGAFAPVRCDTLCLHGDGSSALALAAAVRGALEAAGLRLAPFTAT